jgi:phage major head subunit gpT-like protein
MPVILNSANLRTLYISFSTAYSTGFGSVTPTWKRVAMEVPSSSRSNEYGWLGQFPRIREWIGDRVINSLALHDYRIKNKSWELTIGVKKDDIEDDEVGIYAPMFNEIGRATASFPDELVWPMLPLGFNTPCYDGQFFFDTDHPVLGPDGAVTSVSNFGGGSGTAWYLLDLSRAVKPIVFQNRRSFEFRRMDAPNDEVVFDRAEYRYGVDGRNNVGFGFWQLGFASKQPLTPDNYAAARAALTGMKGDYGRPLGVGAGGLVLAVPTSLEGAGRGLLASQLVNGGETNIWAGSAELLVSPWL